MAAKAPSVKRYVVRLSAEERQQLEALIRKGKSPAQRLLKARILLKADVSEDGEGWSDSRIIAALDTSVSMVYRVRKQLVEEGLEAGVEPQAAGDARRCADFRRREGSQADRSWPVPSRPRACALEPCGCWRARWWSSDRRARQRQHDRAGAKKNALQPHRRKYWVIPPKANSAFVAAMEDVLSVYTRPHDPDRPLVCLDETSKQLIAETRTPIAMRPGLPARVDYEYERNGVANLFMMFAPLEGWRHVKVTDRHTAVDYAHVLKDLADTHFAASRNPSSSSRIISTPTPPHRSTKPFPAAEARRLVERFEWHYTPKHGSLARSGRIRARRPRLAMSRPAHPRQASPRRRGRRLGTRSQQNSRQGRLALHNRRRPHQTQAPLPFAMIESRH